jgi:hypothetical protein
MHAAASWSDKDGLGYGFLVLRSEVPEFSTTTIRIGKSHRVVESVPSPSRIHAARKRWGQGESARPNHGRSHTLCKQTRLLKRQLRTGARTRRTQNVCFETDLPGTAFEHCSFDMFSIFRTRNFETEISTSAFQERVLENVGTKTGGSGLENKTFSQRPYSKIWSSEPRDYHRKDTCPSPITHLRLPFSNACHRPIIYVFSSRVHLPSPTNPTPSCILPAHHHRLPAHKREPGIPRMRDRLEEGGAASRRQFSLHGRMSC